MAQTNALIDDSLYSNVGRDSSGALSSPSPTPGTGANFLGLGFPSSTTPGPIPSILTMYPHLGHYIVNLLASIQTSPPRPTSQHPLSFSSSGSHDELEVEQRTLQKKRDGRSDVSGVDRDVLVRRIVEKVDNEEEEEVKDLLRPLMGDLGKDDILMDQVCLDCMHRRRGEADLIQAGTSLTLIDDVENIPYAPHLTPATRARSSPSVTALPLRPYTPTRVPSFRARTPLGRPQSPSASGSQTPTLPHGSSGLASSSQEALPPSRSPVTSPRMLNAKAASFNPSPRAASATLASALPAFSPSDPWRDLPVDPPRSASPYGAVGPPSMVRSGSNLAIAAPLFSDQSSPFHSPIGTPHRENIKMPDVFTSPALAVPRSGGRGIVPDDEDDDDEFSPFGSGLPKLHHHDATGLNTDARTFEPFGTPPPDSHLGSSTPLSSSIPHSESSRSHDSRGSGESLTAQETANEEGLDLGAGMTPLDVLCSVFTTVPRSELEDALHRSGYDFEGAMAILVSQNTLPRSGSSTPQRISSPRPIFGMGGRGALPINHSGPRDGYFQQGGRSFSGGNMSPGFGGTRSPGVGGTRMCRYYLQGECRRSDCRFSHDLDRALCRFWLRGHCAKGPNCEFMHHFPQNVDPGALASAMSHVELSSDDSAQYSPSSRHTPQPPDDFPDLLAARLGRSRFDPSRNRFANAVKRAAPATIAMPSVQVTGARHSPDIHQGLYSPGLEPRISAFAVPRPSQRIKLRPPTLLPTLRTGVSVNEQYMTTRATSIRLGQARNACLARAADAFRRGDGAAAKRFSREGKSLNERMLNEAADAAQALVRERRQAAQKAVRERDVGWSDDPGDRTQRGRECAGGLGVIMGIAAPRLIAGGDSLSAEERTECLLDLHTLHGSEGADILGQFLAELEREHYRGLAYVLVGEEKHVGAQDPLRGTSKIRLASSIKQCLAEWGNPWKETGGVLCVDACR